jgi:hypothetical protein
MNRKSSCGYATHFLINKVKFKCRTNKMLTACAAHYKYTILGIYGDDTVLLRWKFTIYTSEKAAFYIFLYPFYVCKWFAYFMLSYHFSYIRWQTSLVWRDQNIKDLILYEKGYFISIRNKNNAEGVPKMRENCFDVWS